MDRESAGCGGGGRKRPNTEDLSKGRQARKKTGERKDFT